jgi:hypothetical protein
MNFDQDAFAHSRARRGADDVPKDGSHFGTESFLELRGSSLSSSSSRGYGSAFHPSPAEEISSVANRK